MSNIFGQLITNQTEYMEKFKTIGWITGVKKDLTEARITETDVTRRTTFSQKVDKWEV